MPIRGTVLRRITGNLELIQRVIQIAEERSEFFDTMSRWINPWGVHITTEKEEQEAIRLADKLRGTKENPEGEKQPLPEVPVKRTPENYIYEPPKVIYDVDIFPDLDENIKDTIRKKPERRLPVEADGQTATDISRSQNVGRPITLADAVGNQSFGHMIYSPVSDRVHLIPQFQEQELFTDRLLETQQKGLTRFIAYSIARQYKDDLPPDETVTETTQINGVDVSDINHADLCLIYSTDVMRGLFGKLNILYGFETLQNICTFHAIHSMNAFMRVYDDVPQQYEIVPISLPTKYYLRPDLDELKTREFKASEAITEKTDLEIVTMLGQETDAPYIRGKLLIFHLTEAQYYPKKPKNAGMWRYQIPAPKAEFDWLEDFADIEKTTGDQYAEIQFNESYRPCKGYFRDVESANDFFDKLMTLTTLTEKNRNIPNHTNPARQGAAKRVLKPYRAFISELDNDGDPITTKSYMPVLENDT